MKTLVILLSCVLLTACAPLYPHNTLGEDIGEVALRVIGCPITLCVSEIQLHERRRQQAMEEARQIAEQKKYDDYMVKYRAWYETLDEEQRNLEDLKAQAIAEREKDRQALRGVAAMQALGMMNMGRGGPFQLTPSPPILPPVNTEMPTYAPRRLNCTSNTFGGSQIYTNCY